MRVPHLSWGHRCGFSSFPLYVLQVETLARSSGHVSDNTLRRYPSWGHCQVHMFLLVAVVAATSSGKSRSLHDVFEAPMFGCLVLLSYTCDLVIGDVVPHFLLVGSALWFLSARQHDRRVGYNNEVRRFLSGGASCSLNNVYMWFCNSCAPARRQARCGFAFPLH